MTRFKFESANLIVVGTFNIHIFSPPWLEKCGVVEGAPKHMEFALSRPGFRVGLDKDATKLIVDPQRIEIVTKSPSFDCGSPISKILRRLAETPLVAVGANVTFKANLDETHPLLSNLPTRLAGIGCKRHAASVSLEASEEESLGVSLEQTARLIRASGNHETRSEDSAVLASAAEKFISSTQHLKFLIEEAWGIETESAG